MHKKYKRPGRARSVFVKIIAPVFVTIIATMFIVTGCITIDSGSILEQFKKIEESVRDISKQPVKIKQSPLENIQLEKFNEEVSALVERVTPSVAFILVSALREDFFGNQQVAQGVGSGVIYSRDGYIITNSHVAGGALELGVTLSDGSEYPATLVGASIETDIAVIKIDATGLQPADFATIEGQDVGDFVMAIGSPFGIEQTVTTGIISGKNRNLTVSSDSYPIVDLIQTDAAINPGNSGGPLINIYGEVIGINTLIYSPSGGSSGIGFAIPTDTAVNIAEQIIKYGEPKIPFIGIEIGINETEIPGVLVAGILPDTPAEKSGLQTGDIIVKLGERDIITAFDLLTEIIRSNCGEVIETTVYRNGEYLKFRLQLEECPLELKQ